MDKIKEQQLLDNFDAIRKHIHTDGMKDGVSKYEYPYGVAYQKLVTAGLKPKLRMKHRP